MTCQGISLGLVSIRCCFFLSVTRRGLLLFVLHAENHGRSRGFFVPNLRIIELFPSHGESRRSRIFLSRFFSLSRIFEFSNFFFTRNVAEVTDFLCPEFANYRIVSSHGLSRNNLFYHELSNYRISFTRRIAEITDFLCPETCPWTH